MDNIKRIEEEIEKELSVEDFTLYDNASEWFD